MNSSYRPSFLKTLKSLIGICFILAFFNSKVQASHMMGADMAYKCFGNNKYTFTFKVYRDCRSIPFNSPTTTIMCAASGTTLGSLSYSLVNIRDISPTCISAGKKCNPQNQTIKGTEPGIEEHTFTATHDFSSIKASGCCKVQIGIGQCCRNNAITTGSAGNDFWTYCEIDLCIKKCNSSPVFNFNASSLALCNQPLRWSYTASDIIDNDSLSYSFTDPLTSFTGKTTWDSGFSSQIPFTPYWPAGYDKSKGPDPDANPPIGIYLDPETGEMVATPTNCCEMSIISVLVKEWRKDSSGKYQKIGEIRRDVLMEVISAPGNNIPTLPKISDYSICEGESLSFTIISKDMAFTPPPPAKSILNDTVRLSWQSGMKGASISIDSSNEKQDAIKLVWTTKAGDSKKFPYILSIMATDNACPFAGITTRNYKILVSSIPRILIGRTTTSDSVFYSDNSPNSSGRIWFVNNSKAGSGRILGLTKKEATGIPMRLELYNGKCFKDTSFTGSSVFINDLKKGFIKIYPNPAYSKITIEKLVYFNNSAYEIYDPVGNLILKGDLVKSETEINISALGNGFYILKVKTDMAEYAGRFIKAE